LDIQFCSYCGHQVSDTRLCPYCGNQVLRDSHGGCWCETCQKDVREILSSREQTQYTPADTPTSVIVDGVSSSSEAKEAILCDSVEFADNVRLNQRKPVPKRIINHWNWGGFLLSWLWAFYHRMPSWGIISLILEFISFCYIIMLPFIIILPVLFIPIIPILKFAVSLYLGLKGGQLAWKARSFQSVDEFFLVQRAWAIAGVIVLVIMIVIAMIIGVLIGLRIVELLS